MGIIKSLNWRYATKKFDPTKKISETDLETLKEVIRLSASSYGLQLMKVMVVQDEKTRKKLKEVSWGQSQITDASHLFVFCNYADIGEEDIDSFVNIKAETRNKNYNDFKGYADLIKKNILGLSKEEKQNWAAKQIYIALGKLLFACAQMHIDACPMEGLDNDKYNEILGLKEKGLTSVVVAAVGFRAEDDQEQFEAKARRPIGDLFETI